MHFPAPAFSYNLRTYQVFPAITPPSAGFETLGAVSGGSPREALPGVWQQLTAFYYRPTAGYARAPGRDFEGCNICDRTRH